MTRLIEAESKMRAMGLHNAADTAAQFQRDIARTRAPFLYERWTADIEAFADRKAVERRRNRDTELLRGAGLREAEINGIIGGSA
ncbi:MAG: hypothetical protein J7498_05375 [Sphingobium sp.]|nr:hypothetical protein [Sphingobium sp.]